MPTARLNRRPFADLLAPSGLASAMPAVASSLAAVVALAFAERAYPGLEWLRGLYLLPVGLVAWRTDWRGAFAVVAAVALVEVARAGSGATGLGPGVGLVAAAYRLSFLAAFAGLVCSWRRSRVPAESSRTDPVTGLLDEWALHDIATVEASRSSRYGRPYTFVYLLVGEPGTADAARDRAVGGMLRASLRDTDVAGRIRHGGFGILLPETAADGARDALAKLRGQVDRCLAAGWAAAVAMGAVTTLGGPVTAEEIALAAWQLARSAQGGQPTAHLVWDRRLPAAGPQRGPA